MTSYRHCGICHSKTINKDFCNKCLSRKEQTKKEIEKRLKAKKLKMFMS